MPSHYARERTYDVLHYRLNIDIDEKKKTCDGDVTISLLPLRPELDSLVVDAGEMDIQRVMLDGNLLSFRHEGESLLIHLNKTYVPDETLRIQITYHVTAPNKGLYFITPDSGYPNKQYQVWSQGQPEDNHYWFPCYDYPNDKATSEMLVTVNDKFTAISNGALLDVKNTTREHKKTFHWYEHKPFSSYLISVVVGEYSESKEEWRRLPVTSYVYPSQKQLAGLSFSKTADALEYFSNTIGIPYQWEKYSQTVVQDFIYGGMENLSAATLTDATIHDERAHLSENSDGLMAHELAHQWWGDLVTPRDWSHAWLSEGFASYFDILFQEHDKGRDERDKMVLDAHRSLQVSDIGSKRRPTIWNHYDNVTDIYDNRIYGKGAAVLHMLRYVLGDDLFWKSIHAYAERYKFGLVETNDFKLAIEDVTGYNLQQFFEQWIYHAGMPEFQVTTNWDAAKSSVDIVIKQTQPVDSLTLLFQTPIDIQVWTKNKPKLYRVNLSQAEERIELPAREKPQLVIFDKGNKILKQVEYTKSSEEWLFQLSHAEDGVDRLLAIESLRWFRDSDSVFNALCAAAMNDYVWYVRQAAAFALGRWKGNAAGDSLIKAYGDRDARVRQAVVASLGNVETEEAKKTILYAFEKDASYSVAASALHSLRVVDSSNIEKYCAIALARDSHHEILRSTALNILADVDTNSIQTIKKFALYGNPRELRVEALTILSRTWGEKEEIVDYIISFLGDQSFHVRRAALSIAGTLGSERAIMPLQRCIEKETDTRLVNLARESLKKIQETTRKGK